MGDNKKNKKVTDFLSIFGTISKKAMFLIVKISIVQKQKRS